MVEFEAEDINRRYTNALLSNNTCWQISGILVSVLVYTGTYGCLFSTCVIILDKTKETGVSHFGNRSMFNLYNYFCLILYPIVENNPAFSGFLKDLDVVELEPSIFYPSVYEGMFNKGWFKLERFEWKA